MASKIVSYKLFIGGKWVESHAGETFGDRNPANPMQWIGRFQKATKQDAKAAIDSASKALDSWSATPAPSRAKVLFKAAQLLEQRKEPLSRLMVQEMGKVLKEARGDVQEAIDITYYAAGEGRRLFGETTPSELRNKIAYTIRRPIGVVSLITPWNFPMAIPAWKLMPALVSGNTCVLKPASDTPLMAVKLVETLVEAGLPNGVVNLVTGSGSELGDELVNNRKVHGVSFTGSREAGSKIMQDCGRHIKHVSLELGGKNPIIVMEDANLDLAVEGILWGAFGTTGQRCTACSRVIAHQPIKEKLLHALKERTKKLRLGDGLNPKTDVGPLINENALQKSRYYCEIGREEGAKLVLGGKPAKLHGGGYFFEPTLFDDVDSGMVIAQEEIFGPVLSILECRDLREAIDIANGTEYGLSSSIYTESMHDAFRAIERIDAGITYVNSSTIGAETHLPFGGVKATGNGFREAGSEAVREFTEIKTVYIDYSGKLQKAQIDVED